MPYEDRLGRVCGFLNFEEIESSGSFIRRYFILDHANGRLFYYMDNPINLPPAWQNPKGEIYLQYVAMVSDARKLRPKIPYCFVINYEGRRYYLEAEDEKDLFEWIEALNNACKITVPKSALQDGAMEWCAGDLSQTSYTTEIAGGVVCKLPVQEQPVDYESDSSNDEETLSSGKISPSSSMSKNSGSSTKENSITFNCEVIREDSTKHSFIGLKCGYCVKQGAVRRSWKRRFFILHEEGLSYFRTEHDKTPIRTIPTSCILEAREHDNSGSHSTSRDNLFELITSRRIFYIQCDTPQEVQSWIDAIKNLLKMRKCEERKSMQHPSSTSYEEGCGQKKVWMRDRFVAERQTTKQKKKNWVFW
ncbi:hypothetical protein SNE40_007923 [Patella caerulea]|uniref:PH domain-containing protein n=1 Tax=Patella caerulea TaxID=87958 RepID=A0AAN8JXT4_PATCE